MAWWQWLVGVLVFILALSILIGIHELGHLAAAKAFKVYCFNYSIGFGPILLSSKRSKKHETIWTLRAIPLGGFVSMYGEGAELDTEEYVPISRSLEGVARYKRAIIVSAGVILNFILGFILILFSNLGVKTSFYFKANNSTQFYESCIVLSGSNDTLGIKSEDALWAIQDPVSNEFILSRDTYKSTESKDYMFCFSNSVTSTKVDPKFSDSIVFYPVKSVSEIIETATTNFSNDKRFGFIPGQNRADILSPLICSNNMITDTNEKTKIYNEVNSWSKETQIAKYKENLGIAYSKRGLTNAPDTTSVYNTKEGAGSFTVSLSYYSYNTNTGKYADNKTTKDNVTLTPNTSTGKWDDLGINFKRHQYHYNASQVFSTTWKGWCNANTAVIRGVGALFTGQGQVSGIVGIAKMSSQTLANFGFERYLSLWGMISCNLAIINLLPFPGLDGFTLVVTAYEGIRKKQVPTKLKGIISLIGLALLFTFMIFIIIKDIISLV